MSEVGGQVATYLPRLERADDVSAWARFGAARLAHVLGRSNAERERVAAKGHAWAARFTAESAIDGYLSVYQRVLALERGGSTYLEARA